MNVKFLAACAAAWLVLPLAASAASDSATVGLAKACGAAFAENPDEVHEGGANLRKQLENMRIHGCTPVVAINVFPDDHPADIADILLLAKPLARDGIAAAADLGDIDALARLGTDGEQLAQMLAENEEQIQSMISALSA